jgi:CSLREA domain-containing protein
MRSMWVGIAVLALFLCTAASAGADTYTVTRTDDPNPDACLPGDCSLREALTASNLSSAVDDLIVVPANSSPYEVIYEALTLPVDDEVEIRGEGADRTVVEGDGKAVLFSIGSLGVVIAGITMRKGDGAIQNNGGLTLRGVSVEGNESAIRGGGIQSNGPLTIESSFIGFNRANTTAGGGIQANEPVTLLNSTLAWNSSEGNGGINGNAAVTVSSSAVVFNRSDGSENVGVKGTPLTVRDSIFAGNTNTAGTLNCFSFTAITSLGGNVSDDATCGAGGGDRPNVNPLLGTLALHGGTTQVYDLLSGSPAIDVASQCPPLDQRGVARPQGAACDSGPYEFVPAVPIAAADHELSMRVAKGRLPLTRRGRVLIRLTCPATEASPPCKGRVSLGVKTTSASKRPHLTAARLRRIRPHAAFKIPAGKTKVVRVRLNQVTAELVRESRKARRVLLLVQAQDAAGNRQVIKQRRKLVPR